ncbi:MAG: radical SAM protein [Ruminococcaceae bacterium]|nr:radical SAM protein [Oscillospiraceae bacterium]
MNKNIVLIAFYNTKALGVRYLETAMKKAGYSVKTIFFKGFNSQNPKVATEKEIEICASEIMRANPLFIGLSVMSSMYLESVEKLTEKLKTLGIPLVFGGAFAAMFPERFLNMGASYVIRGDGEIPMVKLANAMLDGSDVSKNPSLCYKREGEVVINEIGDLLEEIDGYGLPTINSENACYIENDTVAYGDPQLDAMSYEVIASRGCPFTCSYCCCINLHRMFPKGVKYVRTRSVESVMAELKEAKKHLKKLVFVHFYDEIFPNTPGWIDEFIVQYKKHIALPFTIWSHPKMVKLDELKKLVSVGLTEVIMGIQSGSPYIRKEIFHRYETDEDIINATQIIRESGVFWASYDFMLQHPFEKIEHLKETYYLVKKLASPLELQLHGLNFLPGTDIVDMAINEGLISREEMDEIMYAPMQTQFDAYWKREDERESRLWYRLAYCWQYKSCRSKCELYEKDIFKYENEIDAMYAKCQKRTKLRYLYKKGRVVLRSLKMRIFK